ncbi:MAG TPA: hypothetical protein VD969_13755 [Symbiobacteriaceae bacterium]|nr:hypothetical protein [Symbiobacteriaceae bacterium]
MAKTLNYVQVSVDVQKVETSYDTYSLARRNPPSAEINRHGRARTNVEGAEEWRLFFEDQKVDPLQPWITTGTNKAQGLIFMYSASEADAGAIAVKWDPDARVYITHFGAAMKECPAVRPVTTVEAQWKPGLDKEGKPCLIINVKAAKAKRAGAAGDETLAARAEEEAAKKAARAAARERITAAKKGASQIAATEQ